MIGYTMRRTIMKNSKVLTNMTRRAVSTPDLRYMDVKADDQSFLLKLPVFGTGMLLNQFIIFR